MRVLFVLLALGAGIFDSRPAAAQAPPPEMFTFQGRLLDSASVPQTGNFNMQFRFYDVPKQVPADPDGTLLLTYRRDAGSGDAPVTATNGVYTVRIGEAGGALVAGTEASLRTVFQNHPAVYLEVLVGAERLLPRTRIVSVGSSLVALTVVSDSQNAISLLPFGAAAGNTGEVRLFELAAGGADYVGFKAPDAIAAPRIWTLPTADGAAGEVLSTNGTGALSWVAPGGGGTVTSLSAGVSGASTAGSGLTFSANPITTVGSIALSNTAVAAGAYGSATAVGAFTVDAQGRLTAAANTAIAIDASQVTAGVLPVARGGTNKNAWTAGSVAFAGSATALAEDNAAFFWDNTNKRLGLGTNAPAVYLDIRDANAAGGTPANLRLQDQFGADPATNLTFSMAGDLFVGGAAPNGAVLYDSTAKQHVWRRWDGNVVMALDANAPAGGGLLVGQVPLSTNPSATLDVRGQGRFEAASGTPPLVVPTAYAAGATVANLSADLLDGLDSTAFAPVNGSANYIQNQTAADQAAGFRITGNGLFNGGSVGIGSTNPQAALDVGGDGTVVLLPRKSTAGDPAGADGMVYYNANSSSFRLYEGGAWKSIATGAGANTALSNLAAVAINTALLPNADNAIDLGDGTHQWRTAYVGTSIIANGTTVTAAELARLAGKDANLVDVNDAVATAITGVGTVTAGTWTATAIGAQYGGTGINTSGSTGVPSIAAGTWSVNAQLPVSLGGTGAATLTSNGVLLGNGVGAITAATGGAGTVLTGTAGAPAFSGSPTLTTSLTSPIVYGSVSASGSLTLESTSNGTKGNVILNPTSGNVGIGSTNPQALLDVAGGVIAGNHGTSPPAGAKAFLVSQSTTDTTQTVYAGMEQLDVNPGAATGQSYIASYLNAESVAGNAFNFTGSLAGAQGQVDHYGTGTISLARGLRGTVVNRSTGTYTDARAADFRVANLAAGTIAGAHGVRIQTPTNSGGGVLTNVYGLYIENQAGGTSLNYAVYAEGGTTYLGGNVGIGSANPQALLDVAGDGGVVLLPRKSTAGDPAGADGMVYYNANSSAFRLYEGGAWKSIATGAGANTALSNLASVAVNTSLLPGGNNTIDLGDATHQWRTAYAGTSVSTPLVTTAGALTLQTTATGGADDIVFQAASAETMRVFEGGNVGIGTTAAAGGGGVNSGILAVAGSADVTGGPHFAPLAVVDTRAMAAGVGGAINFKGRYNSAQATTEFAAIQGMKENGGDADVAGVLRFFTRPSGGTFGTAGERLRIDSAGNVGIGSANPQAILDIVASTGVLLPRKADPDPAGSNGMIYYNTTTNKLRGYQNGAWTDVIGGAGANTALSNLAAVAVNASLLPGADNAIDLGDATHQWRTAYVGTSIIANGTTVTAAELARLAGKDANLVDVNDAVATAITGVGTVTAGTWTATAIGAQYGGTGINTSGSTGVPSIAAGTWSVNAQLPVSLGGTGAGTLTSNGVLLGNGTSAITAATGGAGTVLTGAAGAPAFSGSPTLTTSLTSPIVYGSSSASGSLTLESTSNGTKGNVIIGTAVAGNVGIGSANPQALLDIAGDGGVVLVPRKSTAGDPAGADGMIYYNANSSAFRLYEAGAWKSIATGAGANTALSNLAAVSINQSLTANANNSLDLGASGTTWRTVYAGTSVSTPLVTTAGTLTLQTTATGGADDIVFQTASAETMRVFEGGNVGIGTTAAAGGGGVNSGILAVAGSADVTGGPHFAPLAVVDTRAMAAGVGGAINFKGRYNSAQATTEFAAIQGMKENGGDADVAGVLRFFTRPSGGTFGTAGERLRIDSAGNVGIGSANPQAILDIVASTGVLLPRKADPDPAGSNGMIYYNTTNNKLRGYQNGAWTDVIGGAGANTALSNLAAVAINTALLPNADNTINLGSAAFSWATLYADTSVITPTITTGSGDLSLDPAGDTVVTGSVATSATAALNVRNSTPTSLLFVRNDGNVGIASTNPQAKLDVAGTAIVSTSVTSPIHYGSSAASGTLTLDSTSNGTKGDVRINPTSGNVTIGTTVSSTTGKLSISATTTPATHLAPLAVIDDTAMAAGVGGAINFKGQYTSAAATTEFAAIQGYKVNGTTTDYSGGLKFYTRNNGAGVYAERMRIDNVGNVGLNSISPQSVLDIVGSTGVLLPRKADPDPTGSNGMIYYNTTNNKFRGYQNGAWTDVVGGAGANTALSNLASVAINTSLLPGADNSIDLGSVANSWRTLYADTSVVTPVVYGGTTASASLRLESTTNGTKGHVILGTAASGDWYVTDQGRLVFGDTTPDNLNGRLEIRHDSAGVNNHPHLNLYTTDTTNPYVDCRFGRTDSATSYWGFSIRPDTTNTTASFNIYSNNGATAADALVIRGDGLVTILTDLRLNGNDLLDSGGNTRLSLGDPIVATASIRPDANNTRDLGTSAQAWNEIFTAGTIYFTNSGTGNARFTENWGARFVGDTQTDRVNHHLSTSTHFFVGYAPPGNGVNLGTAGGDIYMSGRLGIGVGTAARPSLLVDVRGTDIQGIAYTKSGSKDARITVGDPTKSWSIASGWATAGDFSILEEGVAGDRLYIKQGGNVGIGSSNPQGILDIVGSTGVIFPRKADPDPTGVNGMIYYNTTSNSFRGYANGSWSALGGGGVGGSGTTNYVPKFTAATTLGDSQIFDNGTNVGIGTASPTNKLEVAGVIKSTTGGVSFPDGTTMTTAAATATGMTSTADINFASDTDNSGGGDTIFATSTVERMRIKSSTGSVGIGSTNPQAKLDIQDGDIRMVHPGAGAPEIFMEWNTATAQTAVFASYSDGVAYMASNLTNDGTNWNRQNTGAAGAVVDVGPSSVFRVRYAGSGANPATLATAMLVNSSGNIGVNSTAPQQKLDVGGAIQYRGRYGAMTMISGNYTVDSGSAPDEFIVHANAGGGDTITLPAPSTAMLGRIIEIWNGNGSSGQTVNVSGGSNIYGPWLDNSAASVSVGSTSQVRFLCVQQSVGGTPVWFRQ